MKIAGLLCMLAACGDNVPYRGVYGVGAGEPAVGALVQVQEVRAIAPPPDMAREPRRVRREREVVVEVGAWRLAGAGTLQGAELRALPTADTCREHALAYGGPGAAADYLWREAARMEVVVPLPTPQPEDLRVVPVVELEAVGRAASFVGPRQLALHGALARRGGVARRYALARGVGRAGYRERRAAGSLAPPPRARPRRHPRPRPPRLGVAHMDGG